MLRRDFLKNAALLPLGSILPGSSAKDFGWLPSFSHGPSFLDTFPQYRGTGEGKTVLLYKYIEAVLKKPLLSHKQTGPDCTSQAGGLGVDFIQAIQVLLKRERWLGKVATEVLHIGGRQTIGGRRSGGVQIKEFVAFLKKYGTVYRRKYREGYDYTTYNYNNRPQPKIPEWLLEECNKHKIIKSLRVSTWSEARDAIRNLHPIVIGSQVGYDGAKRDTDGFVKPRGKWYHAWLLIGIDDRFKRPGGCLMNSHGDNWVKGPRRLNQPKGSVWVDRSVLERMLKSDSHALCLFQGERPVRYDLW